MKWPIGIEDAAHAESEPEDLVATCDRILVYGHQVGQRPASAASPEQLIEEIYATNEATAGSGI